MAEKSLTLETFERVDNTKPGNLNRVWRVVRVKNSTRFNPGAELSRAEVDDLCENNSSWDVTITAIKGS